MHRHNTPKLKTQHVGYVPKVSILHTMHYILFLLFQVMIVLELLSNGDLKSFLMKRRPQYVPTPHPPNSGSYS